MATTSKKMMITDVFVNGAFQGWNIATHSTIPNVLMAFVIIKMLNISGALDFIGTCLGPVMAIFGLPGEAAMILLGGWMSMGGGVGVAVALFDKGAVDGTQLAIVIPAIYLMGSQVQYMGRCLGCYWHPGFRYVQDHGRSSDRRFALSVGHAPGRSGIVI